MDAIPEPSVRHRGHRETQRLVLSSLGRVYITLLWTPARSACMCVSIHTRGLVHDIRELGGPLCPACTRSQDPAGSGPNLASRHPPRDV